MPNVTIREIAAQVGVLPCAVHAKVRRMGLRTHPIQFDGRRHRSLSEEDATRVLATYAQVSRTLDGWLTSREAGRLLGLNHQTLARRVNAGVLKIERRRLVGVPGGENWRYEPNAVRALAASVPVRPRGIPRGALSVPQVCQQLAVAKSTVLSWVAKGLPHGRTLRGRLYIKPAELLTFLEGYRFPAHATHEVRAVFERRARVLRELLGRPAEAAA